VASEPNRKLTAGGITIATSEVQREFHPRAVPAKQCFGGLAIRIRCKGQRSRNLGSGHGGQLAELQVGRKGGVVGVLTYFRVMCAMLYSLWTTSLMPSDRARETSC